MGRESLKFAASAVFVILLVAILGYLTFIPVPDANKDLIVTILGVLLGGAAAAMPNLFGNADAEKEKLLSRVRGLEAAMAVLQAEYDTLKKEYDRITEMLINRHVVEGEGVKPKRPRARKQQPTTATEEKE